jgi:hypothetical protein
MAVFFVAALSVFLAAYLNFAKFEGAYERVEADRFKFAAADIVASLENELDLGITLSRMTSADRVLTEAFARSAGMSGVVVFGLDGAVLFSGGLPPARGTVPQPWVDSIAAAEDGAGSFEGEVGDTKVVGSRLVNNFGRTVGGVAVGYSALDGLIVIYRVGMSLGVGALLVVAAVMVLCSVGLRWLTAGIAARVRVVAAALAGTTATGEVDEVLLAEARSLAAADAEILREVAEAEARLGRISEKVE